MEIKQRDVMTDSSPSVSEDTKTQEQDSTVSEDGNSAPVTQAKGNQTPDTSLYAALAEERAKRKELEGKIKELESSPSPTVEEDIVSDEGRMLYQELKNVRSELTSLKEDRELEGIIRQFPQLKERVGELKEFRSEYPTLSMDKVAKLFIVENNLHEEPKQRKGLEKPSGGNKTPPSSGISREDVQRLRETDPRRYARMIRDGKLRGEDIRS